MSTSSVIVVAVLAVLYLAFLVWYGGRSRPLDAAETEDLLDRMRRRAGWDGSPEVPEPPLLPQFRELAAGDDGREFWMVNLMAFRDQAVYPDDLAETWGDDPIAANARYNRAVVPRLLRHGSHPVFASTVTGRFLDDAGGESWDQVAAVRYRSRRDLLRMAVDLAGSRADVHKWAALETTQVFPVRPFVSITSVRATVAVVLAVVGLVLSLLIR